MGINKVLIAGNLTRDPELKPTSSGMQVLKLGVAVNGYRRDPSTGDWMEYPNFIDCTMFGTRAENVARFVSKGSKVAIEGKLRWSQWERDGQKRSKVEVVVDEIEFMSTRFKSEDAKEFDNLPPDDEANAHVEAPIDDPYEEDEAL